MRCLISLEGPKPGSTRRALAQIPHDAVHVLAVDPGSDELATVRELVERSGATFTSERIPEEPLLEAFEAIVDTFQQRSGAADELACQVNAGKDANVLSAAGLLACLHEGVEAHFVHEKGHTPLAVLSEAPLKQMLTDDERSALAGFPDEGIPLIEVREHDPGALNGLKDRKLVERKGDRLVVTERGRAYRTHLRARNP